ncbi:MAG: hypothetical protein NZ929_07070 [Aigarchaeota archaeon]|nr:hypothetical protein [Aigarchaeota archaeon]MCX8192473.1 hypothetical protein [Nitrososphaeria archaeon]MDW7985791.1 hypothetical protein [Nitrososphaerota archaeon]
MDFKEFFKETSLLALLMTGPPIILLVTFKLLEIKPFWLILILWAIIAISWMSIIVLIYYKKSLKKVLSKS